MPKKQDATVGVQQWAAKCFLPLAPLAPLAPRAPLGGRWESGVASGASGPPSSNQVEFDFSSEQKRQRCR